MKCDETVDWKNSARVHHSDWRTLETPEITQHWWDIPVPYTQWLVDGLLTADGYAAVVGKPKGGKSSAVRALAAAVVTGQDFLGRKVAVTNGTVCYLHLDQKDSTARVAKELRSLIPNREAARRLHLKTARDVPLHQGNQDRIQWLLKWIQETKPDLLIIDLLWQLLIVDNHNAYQETLKAINSLQSALREIGYKGAVVAVIHARKATNEHDFGDDVLGSTAQRGSFSNILMFSHRRTHEVYCVASDQTDRDDAIGEIPETVVVRGPGGQLELGEPFKNLLKKEKVDRWKEDLHRVGVFVDQHPGADADLMVGDLRIGKPRLLQLLSASAELIRREGNGVKGDPYRYYSCDHRHPETATAVNGTNTIASAATLIA